MIYRKIILLILILFLTIFLIVGCDELEINYHCFSLIINNPTKTDYYVKVIPVDIGDNKVITEFIQKQFIIPHEASKAGRDLLIEISPKYSPEDVMFLVVVWKMDKGKIAGNKAFFNKIFYYPDRKYFEYLVIGPINIEGNDIPE